MQRLLVKVRGPREAVQAAQGGAHIVDAEYPASASGTTYPLNIFGIRRKISQSGYGYIPVSTNIGEKQFDRALSCQAAVGSATAGADIILFGIAELPLKAAIYLGDSLVRSVKKFHPDRKVMPVAYADTDMHRYFDPFQDGMELIRTIKADGLLIDVYNKFLDKGLLDYCKPKDITSLASRCHALGKQVWVAGSLSREDLLKLWPTGVDAVGVREAACVQKKNGRLGEVNADIVRSLADSLPE
jgi:uncharacterized protein (UPF0264 family)